MLCTVVKFACIYWIADGMNFCSEAFLSDLSAMSAAVHQVRSPLPLCKTGATHSSCKSETPTQSVRSKKVRIGVYCVKQFT